MSGPLNNVKVLEFAGIGPGPFCGMLLADMGAEVLRIDRSPKGGSKHIVKNGLKQHAAADLVIIDTAGRHKLDEDLVVELEQISEVANANERFLVIDAQVGQSAGPVAANFHDLAGVFGLGE